MAVGTTAPGLEFSSHISALLFRFEQSKPLRWSDSTLLSVLSIETEELKLLVFMLPETPDRLQLSAPLNLD